MESRAAKLASLIAAIAERLDVRTDVDPEFAEIQQNVAPEAMLDEIEAMDEAAERS